MNAEEQLVRLLFSICLRSRSPDDAIGRNMEKVAELSNALQLVS